MLKDNDPIEINHEFINLAKQAIDAIETLDKKMKDLNKKMEDIEEKAKSIKKNQNTESKQDPGNSKKRSIVESYPRKRIKVS